MPSRRETPGGAGKAEGGVEEGGVVEGGVTSTGMAARADDADEADEAKPGGEEEATASPTPSRLQGPLYPLGRVANRKAPQSTMPCGAFSTSGWPGPLCSTTK